MWGEWREGYYSLGGGSASLAPAGAEGNSTNHCALTLSYSVFHLSDPPIANLSSRSRPTKLPTLAPAALGSMQRATRTQPHARSRSVVGDGMRGECFAIARWEARGQAVVWFEGLVGGSGDAPCARTQRQCVAPAQ